jgi:hypothetical protein
MLSKPKRDLSTAQAAAGTLELRGLRRAEVFLM